MFLLSPVDDSYPSLSMIMNKSAGLTSTAVKGGNWVTR